MTAQTQTTDADSDDDYLDDVVVRAALERLQREIGDQRDVEAVYCKRFDRSEKTDYIDVELVELVDHVHANSYSLASIVQMAMNTGAVEVTQIDTDSGRLQFVPTEE